jgi:hypothetical protein
VARDFRHRAEAALSGLDATQTTAREAAMNKIDRYAANFAPPSLILPEYQRFRIDGQGIGERSMAMAAKLPRPEPAAIIAISRVSTSMPQVAKLEQTTKTI